MVEAGLFMARVITMEFGCIGWQSDGLEELVRLYIFLGHLGRLNAAKSGKLEYYIQLIQYNYTF